MQDDIAAIAIVGMAGRFPGAASVAALWDMLLAGREGISRFAADPVDPSYVPAKGVLTEADCFDAAFFGIAPRDAALMDPQQRVFLECAWTALEDAGYPPDGVAVPVGVFAGTSLNSYWLGNVLTNPATAGGGIERLADIDKDFLSTRVAYHLGLTGPALTVQTACSTSLVAVHLACQSLISGECDMALAGGVSVSVPLAAGYHYVEGSIASPDGHCRPFDAAGRGTLNGDGVGIVVLKRLEDALEDGDAIRAVIRGSAVTNDGRARVGFAAPGVEGQARAIRLAQRVAAVDPATVGYVEAHGTATAIGDEIELAALAKAFGSGPEPCVLGSVKSNLGHLDAAAGVTGLIKAALTVADGRIPPTLHLTMPKPGLGARFVVGAAVRPWPPIDGPRRAGVSSFGLGGTNAHAVLEQAPRPSARPSIPGPHPLLLSARTAEALVRRAAELAAWLDANPGADLADVAFTLAAGRSPMPHRRAVMASTPAGAAAAFRQDESPADLPAAVAAWCRGADLDAAALFSGRRVALPTYPFARTRHWIEPGPGFSVAAPVAESVLPPERWLWVPDWRPADAGAVEPPAGQWLVLDDAQGVGRALAPRVAGRLVTGPADLAVAPAVIVLGPGMDAAGLVAWVQAVAQTAPAAPVRLLVAARGPSVEAASLWGAVATLAIECPFLAPSLIDLGVEAVPERDAGRLLAESGAADNRDTLVAYRDGQRLVRGWRVPETDGVPALTPGGVWLVTGGLGGIGLALARHLARGLRPRLVLAGRTVLPPRADWPQARHQGGRVAAIITAVEGIEAAGGFVHLETADLEREGEGARLVGRVLARFGTLHGIIHAAGLAGGGMVLATSAAEVARQVRIKAGAALEMAAALGGRRLELFHLCASQTGVFGGFGQYGYAAANGALDGVAAELAASGHRVVAADWDRWRGTGMAAGVETLHRERTGSDLPGGLSPAEGVAVFDRLCAVPAPQVLVSTRPLAVVAAERRPATAMVSGAAIPPPAVTRQPRPAELGPATPPRTDTERHLAALWEEELGIEGIGVEDDFFTLGGDSLTALRLMGTAQQRHGLKLGLQDVMQNPTIARLAARLDAPVPALVPVFEEGEL